MTTSVPNEAITEGPSVQWDHVDGPLLHWAGHIHWLSMWERWLISVYIKTVDDIARHQWPHLDRLRTALKEQGR